VNAGANAQRKISPHRIYRPAWPTPPDDPVGLFIAHKNGTPPVGAAEGCDLLILILNTKIKRSQPSTAPTGVKNQGKRF
jgi:hypothetical protein